MSDETEFEKDRKELLTKLDQLGQSVENMRAQNSAEHGSLFTKLLHVTEVAHWLRARWQKFMDIPVTQNPKHPEDKD